jgi:hypothetical protein
MGKQDNNQLSIRYVIKDNKGEIEKTGIISLNHIIHVEIDVGRITCWLLTGMKVFISHSDINYEYEGVNQYEKLLNYFR